MRTGEPNENRASHSHEPFEQWLYLHGLWIGVESTIRWSIDIDIHIDIVVEVENFVYVRKNRTDQNENMWVSECECLCNVYVEDVGLVLFAVDDDVDDRRRVESMLPNSKWKLLWCHFDRRCCDEWKRNAKNNRIQNDDVNNNNNDTTTATSIPTEGTHTHT